jgi:hypothetical protein
MNQNPERVSVGTLARTVVTYLAVAAGLWICAGEIGQLMRMDLTFVAKAAIVWILFLMAAELVKIFISGHLADRLVVFIKATAYVVGIYLLLEGWPTGGIPILVSLPFLVSGTLVGAYITIRPSIEARSPIVLTTAGDVALVVVVALCSLAALAAISPEVISIQASVGPRLLVRPSDLLVAGFALSLVSMMVGALKGSQNLVLSAIGRSSPGVVKSFAFGSALVLYFQTIRPIFSGVQFQAEVVEWILLCGAVAVTYMKLRGQIAPRSRDVQLAEWRKHVQAIDTNRDADFDEVVRLIDSFVSDSKKEPLVVYLAYALAQRSISRQGTEGALTNLIAYSESHPPSLMFSWDVNYSTNREKMKRLEILEESLKQIDHLMSIRPVEVRRR